MFTGFTQNDMRLSFGDGATVRCSHIVDQYAQCQDIASTVSQPYLGLTVCFVKKRHLTYCSASISSCEGAPVKIYFVEISL
jgi:hypothetical protein